MARGVIIQATPRFLDALDSAGPKLTNGYYREISDFERRYASSPSTVSGQYDQAEHLKPAVVLEFEVGGGPRMLGHWDPPTLTLLDAGAHRIVGAYRNAWLAHALKRAIPLDGMASAQRPWRLFGSNRDTDFKEYRRELHPDWIYDLADNQAGIAATVRKSYRRSNLNDPDIFVLVGGPGTGKTSILLKVLLDLQAIGARPGIVVSDEVADFVSAGLGRPIGPFRIPGDATTLELSGLDVLLYDDPASLQDVDAAIDQAVGQVRLVVVGFDPCQLDEDVWDEDYSSLLMKWEARPYELRACYRQKETLGIASRRVMERVAESTPFLDKRKVSTFRDGHELVYRIANNISFPNKHGYEHTYLDAGERDVTVEASRIRKLTLWHHVPPVLVAVDSTCELNWRWDRLLRGISHRVVEFNPVSQWSSLRSVKGLEFQHVFLVVNRALFDELESGFEGSGQAIYHARRMLRIPFSRAKDGLVTFVVESPANRAETEAIRSVRRAVAMMREISRQEPH
jgi:hypothetical protein